MKSSAIIPLVLGVVVGLVAIKFGVDAIQRAQARPVETVTAVTARIDIPASVEITEDMVIAIETPATPLVAEDSFTAAQDLVGRVTSKFIPQGAVVAALSLAPPGTPAGLTERIPEGYRAVSVKIDEVSGVAGQVTPGDYVDVIVVMDVRRGRKQETISRIILQRVKVVAIGQNLAGKSGDSPQKLARSATLLVRDVEAPKLHLAQTQGKVTLAMRGVDDRIMAEMGHASTEDWAFEEEVEAPGPEVGPPAPTTASDMVRTALGPQVEEQKPAKENPFVVTVFNGPMAAEGTSAVQRISYAGMNSMQVVNVAIGRGGEDQASAPDSAESLLGSGANARRTEPQDRPSRRGYRRPVESEEPQDREITEE